MTEKYICEKARECKTKGLHCEPHPITGSCKTSYCYSTNQQQTCIPIEEIGYTLNEGGYSSGPENVCRYGIGTLNIKTHGGCTEYNTVHGYKKCQYFYGIDKEKKIIWCTYKSQHKEEVKMEKKYEPAQANISMMSMSKVFGCQDFRDACKEWLSIGYNLQDDIIFNTLISVAQKHNGIGCLLSKGFIKEVKEEVFYKINDRFNVKGYGGEAILCQTDRGICNLVLLSGNDAGNRLRDPIKVDRVSKITQAELDKISNGYIIEKI